MRDILDAANLDEIRDHPEMPTLNDIEHHPRYTFCDKATLNNLWLHAVAEWQRENTALYHVLMANIDLSGPFMISDIEHIKRHFVAPTGKLRSGTGLLKWLDSLSSTDDVRAQAKVAKDFMTTKLKQSCSLKEVHLHVDFMLSTWRKGTGNNDEQPAAFYHGLLTSLGDHMEGKPLHDWLAGLIAENSHKLNDLNEFITLYKSYASLVFKPDGRNMSDIAPHGQFTIGSKKNDCMNCDSYICKGKGDKANCLVFGGIMKPEYKQGSSGQNEYINDAREYVKISSAENIKGMSACDMRAKVKEFKAKGELYARAQKGAVNMAIVAPSLYPFHKRWT